MASTYSTSLRIQLIETGTENEAWGTPTDNNFGTIIEQAITGVNSISLTNLTSLTLTASNAAVDQSRNAVLVFTGTPTANCNVVAPSVNKVYIVSNQTTGGYNVNMKTSGGDILAIPPGSKQLIFCNGTAFTSVVNPNAINGDLSISNNLIVGGNVTAGTNVVLGRNITSNNGNLTFTSASNIVSFQQSTGALKIPFGTTGQRPSSPDLGMQRWNTDLGVVEVWNGSIWLAITGATAVNYLVVAGGGGGGGDTYGGGGGGAGGVSLGSFNALTGYSYTIVVGSGGTQNNNGANSSIIGNTANVVSIGGGAGAVSSNSGNSGGSGGGGANSGSGGSGTTGQGYTGGAGGSAFGGGGGASAAGSAGFIIGGGDTRPRGGSGGAGVSSSITGSAVTYAGGGGGGGYTYGLGGSGGGGNGADGNPPGAIGGTNNTGGGGGGSAYNNGTGASGGSGIVIVSYSSTTQRATGGTVTTYTSGGATYYVHTFTSSGTLTF